MINCKHGNAFEYIKELKDLSIDIIFSDPPYSLGSKLETIDNWDKIHKKIADKEYDKELAKLINNHNKLDIQGTGADFMNIWSSPKGKDWEIFFKESYRILKHGGFILMYGMEEAGSLFNYYASMSGFELNQEILYMYGSSFPKNLNLSKAVDRKLRNERKVIGRGRGMSPSAMKLDKGWNANNMGKDTKISISTSELGQKYECFHAGVKPLKANKETIYVFHKPLKYKSYIDDLLAYENGETDIHVSAWDIESNRIEGDNTYTISNYESAGDQGCISRTGEGNQTGNSYENENKSTSKRYPSQLLFDQAMADRLDEQSGELTSGGGNKGNNKDGSNMFGSGKKFNSEIFKKDTGGASRFFEVIPYLHDETEKFIYSSKVNGFERDAGLENFDNQDRFGEGNYSQSPVCSICDKTINGTNDHSECELQEDYKLIYKIKEENSVQKNNHSTLKSLLLNKKVLDLCKTPNRENETIFIPFSGVWSEIIGAVASGFKEENIYACELTNTKEHPNIDIGKARYKYWKEYDFYFKVEDKKEYNKKKAMAEKKSKTNKKRLF